MMMINCKKAAELTCAQLDRPLTLREWLQWRFHLAMCRACKAFYRQNEAILRLFEQRFRNLSMLQDNPDLPALPPNACERLKRRLHEAAAENAPPEKGPDNIL